jgi:hypothetical protein
MLRPKQHHLRSILNPWIKDTFCPPVEARDFFFLEWWVREDEDKGPWRKETRWEADRKWREKRGRGEDEKRRRGGEERRRRGGEEERRRGGEKERRRGGAASYPPPE